MSEVSCLICGFEAKSETGLLNHQRQDGCRKRQNMLKYRDLSQQGIFGEMGIVAYDPFKDKVQCHICGKWFHFLGGHVKVHEISLSDYKEEFGLNRHEPLCGQANKSYRSELCSKLRAQGKFHLMPPPPPRDYKRRLQTLLKSARRERSENELHKLVVASKGNLKRRQKNCVRCGHSFIVKVPHEKFLDQKKYCPACRYIVELERKKDYDQKRREEELAQRPENWREDLHKRRSAKAKEFWQKVDAYDRRSVEVSCPSCNISFRVLAFNRNGAGLCPDCKKCGALGKGGLR